MADIIETIKQGADDLLSGIDQKGQIRSAIDGIRSQWSELDRRRKMSSLQRRIKAQRDEMKQLTEALGLQALSLYEAGAITNPELARLCERIAELRTEIEEQKAQIEQMKAEAQAQAEAQAEARTRHKAASAAAKCSHCGATVPANAEFCHKCGTAIETPAPVPAASAPAARASAARAPAAPRTAPPVTRQATVVRLRCPQCKAILPADAEFCTSCGVKFKRPSASTRTPSSASPAASGPLFCPACGAETKPNARFCPICGQTMA